MQEQLRRYVESLFEETRPTKKAVELKEEMIQNLEDKYSDLLKEGKTPEAAFNIAVAGIGDVSGLLKQLEDGFLSEPEIERYEQAKRRSAALTAIAVMMYILSILPFPILSAINSRIAHVIGIPIFIVMVAIATGLLVYNNMTKPKSYCEADSVVDEFREWQSDNRDRRQMRTAISSALWALILVLYFILSFATMAWHVTWILFLVGGLTEALINVFSTIRRKEK